VLSTSQNRDVGNPIPVPRGGNVYILQFPSQNILTSTLEMRGSNALAFRLHRIWRIYETAVSHLCTRFARCAATVISSMVIGLTALSSAWGRSGSRFGHAGNDPGVITFTAPFVPTSMEVDARDSSNQYTATANATQNDPVNCPAGSANWCYSVIVESALASAYYLRPIAYVYDTAPIYITNRVPLPPSPLVSIYGGRDCFLQHQLPAGRDLGHHQRQRFEQPAAADKQRVRQL